MKLKNTSASQVETWTACPRAWHFQSVKGFRSPPTESQQRGTLIHAGAEHAVKKSQTATPISNEALLLGNDYDPYVRSMLPHLPLGHERVRTEFPFALDTAPGLPPWFGVIDLVDDSRTFTPYLRIFDYKSTSDFRYAKTPKELAENTQVSCYAKWAFENGHDEELVQVGHLYVLTAKKAPKTPRVLPVLVEVNAQQVDVIWESDLVKVEEMVRAAEIDNTDLLEPKGTSNGQCKKYGGCPHRARCGISQQTGFPSKKEDTGTMSNDFLKRMQEKKAAAAAAAAAATPAAPIAAAKPTNGANGHTNGHAKVPTGVVPPDAPSRTTPVKARPAQAPVEGEIDHAEPTGASEIAAAAQTSKPAKAARTKKAVTNGSGFVLYIDCMPVKDIEADMDATLFEDWINPVRMTLNEETMTKKSLPDYRLLPFSEEKALLALALGEKISGDMPSALIINSSSPGAKDALDSLIPHAKRVVRALRG